MSVFNRLDHIAILVADTEKALEVFHHKLGFPLVFSEILEDQGVRLTHLDMGSVQLQLVQPLRDDIPLARVLAEKGEGLHHICFYVDDLSRSVDDLRMRGVGCRDALPRSAPHGKKAVFLKPEDTYGVLVELTSPPQQ
ncbi:MAG: VOC family protein [Thermogutta sp.]|uniref:VOC family protein n=1 Tax=Thermogutta sp. TaxID=1962930 RepID=UPI00199E2890|nr:VOC family protein [Thermogutta sp.]MBC7350787.1 VOC family protein [Thermogutta sp.]